MQTKQSRTHTLTTSLSCSPILSHHPPTLSHLRGPGVSHQVLTDRAAPGPHILLELFTLAKPKPVYPAFSVFLGGGFVLLFLYCFWVENTIKVLVHSVSLFPLSPDGHWCFSMCPCVVWHALSSWKPRAINSLEWQLALIC